MGPLVALHLRWCALRNLRPGTVTQRRYALARLERALGPLDEAPAEKLGAWYDGLVLLPESRATELAHVKQFYKWLQRSGHRADDPTGDLVRPRVRPRLPRPMSNEDLDVAIETAPERVKPMLMCAVYAGLRACEIAALRREDVRDDVLLVADGKGGRQRVLPLHPLLAGELRRPPLPPAGYLFRYQRGTGPLPASYVSQLVNRHLHELGISATLHQARHWFGTNLYQLTLDLRLTQDLMGHASPVSTAGYAAWSPRGRETVSSLSVRPLGDEGRRGVGRAAPGGKLDIDEPGPDLAHSRPQDPGNVGLREDLRQGGNTWDVQ